MTFQNVHFQLEGGWELNYPPLYRVRQRFMNEKLTDIRGAVQRQFAQTAIQAKFRPGMRVAVAVGSRGIANLRDIVHSVVQEIDKTGALPFIVPSMGSHGGATSDGQREVLAHYGITEATIGCPIRSSMDTVVVGTLQSGVPVHFDRHAYESDAIVVINRVKPHTDFKGTVESGLQKMMVIGLGNHVGATILHGDGIEHLGENILEAGKLVIENTNMAVGIAVLENAYDETCDIRAVPAEQIAEVEPRLLQAAKESMPKLLLDAIDLLVVDEIGKDISGTGMDPNITGRTSSGLSGFSAPPIQRILIRDLTEKSHGNAAGVGLADVITRRLYDKIDFSSLYANTITSTLLMEAKIPVVMGSDKEALAVAVKTCNRVTPDKVKLVWIKNTLQLEYIYVSEPCLAQLRGREEVEIEDEPTHLEFDPAGRLVTALSFR